MPGFVGAKRMPGRRLTPYWQKPERQAIVPQH